MGQNYLSFRHISHPAIEAVDMIDRKRLGLDTSLKTPWAKLNNALMGGIEWNTIFTLGGISGSGKSAIQDEMETGFFELNPNETDMAVISFNFEMLSSRRVIRKLSKKMNMTVQQLFSADPATLSKAQIDEQTMQLIKHHAQGFHKFPIYYVDTPGTPGEITATFEYLRKDYLKQYKKFIILLDHTILTRRKNGEKENEMLGELQREFVFIKKQGAEKKLYDSIIIQTSQLNRDIEKTERIMSPSGQYPIRSDIFGGDAVYQASDYVMISHRPELLYIDQYGPEAWPVENKIYWHILKNRDGSPEILQMINNLQYNRVDE